MTADFEIYVLNMNLYMFIQASTFPLLPATAQYSLKHI